MTQNKDPRNTKPQSLAERSAQDSAENLAQGGRVIDSVFNDPTVRAALGDHAPTDRYKEQRAALIAKNDALLRSQRMDDNAYWERPEKAQRRLILKHQFSSAKDSEIAIEVDHEHKAIYVEADPGRVPVSQVAQYIVHSVDLDGEDAFDDDTREGFQCRRTAWRIVIRSGENVYRLVITRQLEKNWDYDLRVEPKE